jgi:hypothetical protein
MHLGATRATSWRLSCITVRSPGRHPRRYCQLGIRSAQYAHTSLTSQLFWCRGTWRVPYKVGEPGLWTRASTGHTSFDFRESNTIGDVLHEKPNWPLFSASCDANTSWRTNGRFGKTLLRYVLDHPEIMSQCFKEIKPLLGALEIKQKGSSSS